jgi:hypothetical protein
MIHVVQLRQEDVAVVPHANLPYAVAIQLTLHGLARLDEARTRYGDLAVHVRVEFPSDEFYPAPADLEEHP